MAEAKAKKNIIVALEKLQDEGVGKAYAQIIENESNICFCFRLFFDVYILKEANAITDEWTECNKFRSP